MTGKKRKRMNIRMTRRHQIETTFMQQEKRLGRREKKREKQ